MSRFTVSGMFRAKVIADNEEQALEQMQKVLNWSLSNDIELEFEHDSVDEEIEYERCEGCSKKVSSTELEQNKGVCYVCAHPGEDDIDEQAHV